MPMLISTTFFLVMVFIFVLLGPETRGKSLTSDIGVLKVAEMP